MFERFDIDLNDESDDLLDSIDDMIFDDDGSDDDLDGLEISAGAIGEDTLNSSDEEDDDTISEEDLEKLLIGIDEENGILDIPDEEEVLEELKFVEDLPKSQSKPKEGKSKKVKKEKKPKKEKAEKEGKKLSMPKIELGGFKEKVLKYKFHIAAVFVSFLVLTGVSIKLMSGKNKKVETEVFTEELPEVTAITNVVELSEEVIKENLTTEEQLAVYRGKLKSEELPEERREEIQTKLKEVEEEIREEKREEIKNYVKDLKADYNEELETVKPTVFKIQDQNLIIGFVIKNYEEDIMYSEVYNAIVNAFEKNENVKNVNVNVFAVEDQLRKKVEINAARYEFERVKEMNIEAKEKLLSFQTIKR